MRRRSSVAGISRSRGESQWRNLRELLGCVHKCEHVLANVSHSYTSRTHDIGPSALAAKPRRGARPTRDRASGDRVPVLVDAITEAVASISLREAPWWVSSGVTWCDAAHVVKLCMQTFIHLFRCNQGGKRMRTTFLPRPPLASVHVLYPAAAGQEGSTWLVVAARQRATTVRCAMPQLHR
jgi:hypothetical protein